MSDAMISAIVGAVIGGIFTGLVTYLIARAQWKSELKIEKARQESEREAAEDRRRRELNNDILDQLSSVFIPFPIQHAYDADYIHELNKLEQTYQLAIKKLWFKEEQREQGLADQLDDIIRDYFQKLKQYVSGDNHFTEQQMEACRQTTKAQVKEICNNILLRQNPSRQIRVVRVSF